MFAHILTAARGLFIWQAPAQENSSATLLLDSNSNPSQVPTTSKMTEANGTVENNADSVMINGGKRKVQVPTTASSGVDQSSKRRKMTKNGMVNGQSCEQGQGRMAEGKNHFRFGSGESSPVPQDVAVDVYGSGRDGEESSDDDEAPEAIDNSAQLASMKMEARKREEVKRRWENGTPLLLFFFFFFIYFFKC